MKWEKISFLYFAATAAAAPKGVTANLPAKGDTPTRCRTSFEGEFEFLANKVTSKHDLEVRPTHQALSTPRGVTLTRRAGAGLRHR